MIHDYLIILLAILFYLNKFFNSYLSLFIVNTNNSINLNNNDYISDFEIIINNNNYIYLILKLNLFIQKISFMIVMKDYVFHIQY
jgi:hypothetical protein